MLTRRAFIRGMLWLPPTLLFGTSCTSTSPGATAKLDYGPLAALGGTMTFRVTITPRVNLPAGRAPGVRSGTNHIYFWMFGLVAQEPLDPQWSVTRPRTNVLAYYRPVTLKAHVSQTAELLVRLDQPGDFTISAGAGELYQTSPFGLALFAQKTLYLRITTAGTEIQDTPFSFTPQP